MLRIFCSENACQAKHYYTSGLKFEANPSKIGQYYEQEQEVIGQWQGKGAELLGLRGRVDQNAFDDLCENRCPGTDERLTVRTLTARRVGYDFNFNCPKSVSVVHALTGDVRILSAFQESVTETMRQIESDMKTRVRMNQANGDRPTGNLVWGEIIHFTARPVNGIPDPQLHAHCFTFNATYDSVEKRWKAGEFGHIKRDARYYEACFHARLAQKVSTLGYTVGRSGDWWEIRGVSQEILQKFSQRSILIEETAKRLGIEDADRKDHLGASTREKKTLVSMANLKREWSDRLTSEEKRSLSHLFDQKPEPVINSREATDYAMAHCYERSSVVTDKTLAIEALWRGVGQVTVGQVGLQLHRSEILSQEVEGQRWCTTKDVLQEEWENIDFVKSTQKKSPPLLSQPHTFQNPSLGADQRNAVLHVLCSTDRVFAIRGPAGTGKTTMMQETISGIESGGHRVFTFAPSAESSRGNLREAGFPEAQTVAYLLKNEALQTQLKGQVIWIDEAGLLSARQMHGIFTLAKTHDCRVILSGDSAQHTSIERGDALRLLEKYADLKPAELTEIRRQRKEDYKAAVRDLAKGNASGGFGKLDRMEAIKEMPDERRYEQLAKDYADLISRRKNVLVVSPTHAEGEQVTGAIREELTKRRKLSGTDKQVPRLVNLQWTEAQCSNPHEYRPGMIIQFHQNVLGITRGTRFTVTNTDENGSVRMQDVDGRLKLLPINQGSRFQVFEASTLSLRTGDWIRVTQNGYTAEGNHRLNNGALQQVKGFSKNGDIKLSNGWVISNDFGHFVYGYCQTSHTAQSKTVDHVLIAQSTKSLGASSAEQFYVSVSRARESVTVYTDDKVHLAEAIQTSGLRLSAHELLKSPVTKKADGPFETMLQEQHPAQKREHSEHQKEAVKPAKVVSHPEGTLSAKQSVRGYRI